ncbi:MAG: hypothetical protein V2A66_05595 [Pseudomonadota bacterium]
MHRLIVAAMTAALICAIASHAQARPRKGFHSGPYLALEVGVVQEDFDNNRVTGRDVGNNLEPTFGFLFGWNIWDSFSAELQGRYATSTNGGSREHIANANAYARWSFITDALTNFESLRILPFLKAGLAVRVEALPGAPTAPHGTVTRVGIGPSVGGGLSFLVKKYLYFGVDLQEDLFTLDDLNQTVNGVPNVLVYKGGFHPSFSGAVMLGVHY